ncbi:hypothetical protein B0A55_05632 [Friedmanniomyces simplex]|uniref:Phosphatidylethanolamine-binding protein n=1 Tax=Friedmanniomyces simplex TaxID=329884 RepID=A0A4U0X9M3_9PEZI|nr:hypothetical protein B0A55_05632 [Friedmanniomyces simplex]
MASKYLLVVALAAVALVRASPAQLQQPLSAGDVSTSGGSGGSRDLIYELKKAEIIPTVIDVFDPKLALSISWENATAEVGNTVAPSKTQKEPVVRFVAAAAAVPEDGDESEVSCVKKGMQLTIALTDPDAPSREDPEWSEICHWIATGVPLTEPTDDDDDNVLSSGGNSPGAAKDSGKGLKTIMPYKPPGPPPKTGKHRYVFVALAPTNGTTEKLHLSTPEGRQHWGFGKERQGLRGWAGENGLVVVV